MRWILLALAAVAVLLVGCGESTIYGKANPRWEFRTPNGAYAMSSKDDNFKIKGFKMTKPDGTVLAELEELDVQGNASGPRQVDVLQTRELTQHILAFNEGITRTFAGIGYAGSAILGGMTDLAAIRNAQASCGNNPELRAQLDAIAANIQARIGATQQSLLDSATNSTSVAVMADKINRLEAAVQALVDKSAGTQPGP